MENGSEKLTKGQLKRVLTSLACKDLVKDEIDLIIPTLSGDECINLGFESNEQELHNVKNEIATNKNSFGL